MTHFYSPSVRGFYATEIHGSAMPSDVVPVTDDDYRALFEAQAEGKEIVPGEGGHPVAQDRPAQPLPSTWYVPSALIRERLQAAGKWDTAAAALMAQPAMLLWFATLSQGVASDDAQAISLISGIGADPGAILARP